MYPDGVVLVDPDYLKDRKVFSHVLAAFRYGREDLDVLGLAFRKDLFLATQQVYPPPSVDNTKPLTRLQERLIKKLGANAYPFYFEVLHTRYTRVGYFAFVCRILLCVDLFQQFELIRVALCGSLMEWLGRRALDLWLEILGSIPVGSILVQLWAKSFKRVTSVTSYISPVYFMFIYHLFILILFDGSLAKFHVWLSGVNVELASDATGATKSISSTRTSGPVHQKKSYVTVWAQCSFGLWDKVMYKNVGRF